MLNLDSDKWKTLKGGYGIIYDASIPLKKLESAPHPDEKIWNELWEELFHQGDVGIASYAVIPTLFKIYKKNNWIDFQLPNFTSAIERARFENHNPALPEWLSVKYFQSLEAIAKYCLENFKNYSNENFSRAVLLLIAILAGDLESFELLDKISIGDEKKAIKLYYEYA